MTNVAEPLRPGDERSEGLRELDQFVVGWLSMTPEHQDQMVDQTLFNGVSGCVVEDLIGLPSLDESPQRLVRERCYVEFHDGWPWFVVRIGIAVGR